MPQYTVAIRNAEGGPATWLDGAQNIPPDSNTITSCRYGWVRAKENCGGVSLTVWMRWWSISPECMARIWLMAEVQNAGLYENIGHEGSHDHVADSAGARRLHTLSSFSCDTGFRILWFAYGRFVFDLGCGSMFLTFLINARRITFTLIPFDNVSRIVPPFLNRGSFESL